MVKIIFQDSEGKQFLETKGKEGENLLNLAQKHDIDLEGACEGCMACSTCHVIITQDWFDKLPPPSDEEDDMLDLTIGITQTSRLGCQIILTKNLDGLIVRLPNESRNMLI
ncbi:MAG: ferredoxin family 2Fe-2S iron-sulfur cluster binding protein [Sphingomonadales bacterium]|jgi:ferredoxin|tara:strand:- start:175 stop:507 length:333 start_codon:yes stop_codon:yes gene_type:complete